MNRELYRFLSTFREPDGFISDLLDVTELDKLPNKSGAYIFLSQKQKFVYPRGSSQIIYIGMSKNLSKRVSTHHKISSEINKLPKHKMLDEWYYNRYQYIQSFGCKVFWYTTRGLQKHKNLESLLLEHFYDKYYALPIGNGAFSLVK
jgi:hypothetical protein